MNKNFDELIHCSTISETSLNDQLIIWLYSIILLQMNMLKSYFERYLAKIED